MAESCSQGFVASSALGVHLVLFELSSEFILFMCSVTMNLALLHAGNINLGTRCVAVIHVGAFLWLYFGVYQKNSANLRQHIHSNVESMEEESELTS